MEIKPSYDEFEPMCRWRKEKNQTILEVHVQGFRKDQLKIQLDTRGILTITGKRPISETKFTQFKKVVNVPKNCRSKEIHAKISGGILQIMMPKKIRENERSDENDDDEPAMDQPATRTGTAVLNRSNARRFMTALRDSIVRNGSGRNTARRVGVAIGVVVTVAIGGYLAYTILRSFQFKD